MKRFGALVAVAAVVGLVCVSGAFAEEGKAPAARPAFGQLTKIDGKVLTISSQRGDAAPVERTATVGDETEITQEAPAKLEDLKVGDRVRIVQGDRTSFGEIAKIEGKTLTLKSRRGEDQTVTVEAGATISARVKAKFEDLKVGQQVTVSITDGKAVRVDIRPASAREGPGGREKRKGGEAK